MKKRLSALALALAMALSLAACGNEGGSTPSNSGSPETTPAATDSGSAGESGGEKVLTAGVTTAWTTLVATGGSGDIDIFIRSLLYDSLVNTDMDGEIHPRLAKSWECDDTSTVWTIHIDENATWSDGEPVTAADVAYTYGLYATPGFCNFSTYVAYIDGTEDSGVVEDGSQLNVVAQDDKTLVITTKFPITADLLFSNLQFIYVIPEHIFGQMDPSEINDAACWAEDPVTSGPLVFVDQVDGQSIEFVANEDYFLGAPNIDRLIVKVVASSAVASSLMSGDIDLTAGSAFCSLSVNDYDLLAADESVQVEAVSGYNYRYLCLNQQLDIFSDVRVRQALSMAINRQEIVDSLLNGYGMAVYTPWGTNHPYYNQDLDLTGYEPYDPDGAKALLEEAGFDFSQKITITAASNSEIRQQICMMVQQYWQAIGVQCEVETVDFPTLFSGLSSGETMCGIMGQVGNASAMEPIDAYTPGHAIDMSHLVSDSFYETFLAMKNTGDQEEIQAMSNDLQQQIVDQVPFIYLVSEAAVQACRSNVTGFDMSDSNCRYWPVWEWDIQ